MKEPQVACKILIDHLQDEWGAGVCTDYNKDCEQCRMTKLRDELVYLLAELKENEEYGMRNCVRGHK